MKRITASTIKWGELEKRVPPEQRGNFYAFKGKSEAYLRRFGSIVKVVHNDEYNDRLRGCWCFTNNPVYSNMLSSPADAPKIDWEQYKKLVPVPGLVEKFQAAYASYKIPYPEDKLSASIDKQWSELQPKIAKYCETQKQQIAAAEKEIARINALPKYEDMTMEMVRDLFPEVALDPVNKPTFWPHTEDEQLDYVDPTARTTK